MATEEIVKGLNIEVTSKRSSGNINQSYPQLRKDFDFLH